MIGNELEEQLAALRANGVNLNDRHAVKAKAFELGMKDVEEALHSISHLKESKRGQAWSEILRETMPIEKAEDIDEDPTSGTGSETAQTATTRPDPTQAVSEEGGPSVDSAPSSEPAAGSDEDPTTPLTESSDSPSEEERPIEPSAPENGNTSSSSTPVPPKAGDGSEKSK